MAEKQAADFATFVQNERARLTNQREDTVNQMQIVQARLDEIDREMRAIEAYVAAKEGRAPIPAFAKEPPKGQASRRRGVGRRGGIRDEILALIKGESQGMTRADIIEKKGVRGDKSGEQSISNALTNMKKAGQVTQDNGRYLATQVD